MARVGRERGQLLLNVIELLFGGDEKVLKIMVTIDKYCECNLMSRIAS